MSHDFNLDGLLNYDDDQAVSPDTIISELGKQLEEATNGFVKGVVREYEGSIESYDQLSAFASIASALGTSVRLDKKELKLVDKSSDENDE